MHRNGADSPASIPASSQSGFHRNGADSPASIPASSQSGVHRNGADSPASIPTASQSGFHRSGTESPDSIPTSSPPGPYRDGTDAPASIPTASQSSFRRNGTTLRRISVPELPTPAPQPQDEVILGIDLGTTNSRAAVFVDGVAKLVPLSADGRTVSLPSVVALDEKERFLVGARAKAQILIDPINTVFGAKRLMGRRARSRHVREVSKRFPWKIVADPEGDAGVELRGKTFSLPEIASKLLGTLKDAAQTWVGRVIHRCVLCVPAYFNDHQRSALLQAGRLAGLEVMRIFNEPSAVALAYGYGRGLARKRVLVYDLGGGTFDASIVEITGDDLDVVATGGDNFLGGMDFDLRVADELNRALEHDTHVVPDGSLHSLQRIRDAAEQAKITLSDVERTAVHVPFASTLPDGSPVDLRTELTRQTLEGLTADLVERTVETTLAVLQAANLGSQSIDEVLLVGGQSLAPLVHRRMAEALGRPTRSDVDPHGAVALGAAILGHALARQEKGRTGVVLSEILSLPIGIGVKGGGMKKVLDRNTRLPAEKTLTLPVKAGVPLGVAVFQGDAGTAEDNEYLGSLQLSPERSGEANLRFILSPDGLLQVTAQSPGARTEVTLATSDASEAIRQAVWANAPLPGEEEGGNAREGGLFGGIRRLFGRR
ncbi:MAG: Hsp70 family protein [Myxococcaceae bacterium]|nr:Hsp70 family protein [Myxococcaceae bacterium]